MANPRVCSVPDCGKPHNGLTYCLKHRLRFKRHGDPLGGGPDRAVQALNGEICRIQGCTNVAKSRFLCAKHVAADRKYGDPTFRMTRAAGESTRFIQEVATQYEGDGCLLWPFNVDKYGYGTLLWDGRKSRAHRIVCELTHGPRSGVDAAHLCGNSLCVAPRHIEWKSRRENIHDKLRHGTMIHGEKHPASKLTLEQVRIIRSSDRPGSEIAAQFSISPSTVSRIRKRLTWAREK